MIALLASESRSEAAKSLGIVRSALYERIDKYGLNKLLEQIPNNALGVLQQGSIKAAENFVGKIDHRDARVSMDASKEVLDRVGVGKGIEQQNNTQVNIYQNLNDEQLEQLIESKRRKVGANSSFGGEGTQDTPESS